MYQVYDLERKNIIKCYFELIRFTHLCIEGIPRGSVIVRLSHASWFLKYWECGAVGTQEAVTQLWALRLFKRIPFRPLLFHRCRHFDVFVVKRKKGNRDSLCRIVDGSGRDPSPVANVPSRGSIAIVSKSIERNRDLNPDVRLGIIGIICKDGVTLEFLDDFVESRRSHSNFVTKISKGNVISKHYPFLQYGIYTYR